MIAIILIYFFVEVKEEEKVPEEEKMDTSKWENTAHTYHVVQEVAYWER